MLHSAVAERLGLSVTGLKTLDLLQRFGPMTAGEIAARTGLMSASVTSLVDSLERKRLVRRLRDRADRRRVIVTLTPAMEANVAPFFESLRRRMLDRFRKYTDEQIASIVEFLTTGAADMRDEAANLSKSGRT